MAEVRAASPPGTEPREGQRVRVLVVDDSLDHRMLIAGRLGRHGMGVEVAATAEEAFGRLDGVDVVLLDYRLPGASGLETLTRIRTRPNPPSVVMVTGAGSVEVAVEAMRAGATNYVAKDRGYLEALPEVVERAARHRDLVDRTEQLQRLALLVSSATDRDRLVHEIAGGAIRLLRADSCALLTHVDGRLVPAATLGPVPDDLDEVITLDVDTTEVHHGAYVTPDRLVIPLPAPGDGPIGMLALWSHGRTYAPEEIELGRVFASFAAIALRNLRQLELERRLVAELQQTLDARRDFVASVSHELRTPLTAIGGFAATVREHFDALGPERCIELLGRVERNADALAELVDELLELAKLERGRGELATSESLDLAAQVTATVEELGSILGDRHVAVRVPSLHVRADGSLLRRTLANLLSNAAKFSPSGTPVEVRAVAEGDLVRVEVIDRGIGLSDTEAARVFDPFFRASSSVANAVRGSGIGLALVREYVRGMGGEVGLRTVPGRGSTFWFTLPLAVEAPRSQGS